MTNEIRLQTIKETTKSPEQLAYENGVRVGEAIGMWDGLTKGILIGCVFMLLAVVCAWALMGVES